MRYKDIGNTNTRTHMYTNTHMSVCDDLILEGAGALEAPTQIFHPTNQPTNWKPREMRTSCFRLFSVFFCFVIGYLHLYFCSRDWSVEAISGAQLKSQSDCFCVCHRSQRRERHGLIDKYATNTNGCDPNTTQ